MILKIKNLGPIKEANIDLSKRSYLFVGYNNTGKTYLAKVLYDVFNHETIIDFSDSKLAVRYEKISELNEEIVENILKSFAKYLKQIVLPKSLKIDSERNDIIADLELSFEYNFELNVKAPQLKSGSTITIESIENDDKDIEIYTLEKEKDSLKINYNTLSQEEIIEKLPSDFFDEVPKNIFLSKIDDIRNKGKSNISRLLLSILLQNDATPYFLPANRIFLLENANEFVEQQNRNNKHLVDSLTELIENENYDKTQVEKLLKRNKSTQNHTRHISNLISNIASIRTIKNEEFIEEGNGFYNDLIKDLISLMGGQITLQKSTAISDREERFRLSTDETKVLRMHLVSSSVNQLGMLYLYLKFWAKRKGNFLLIDEPEENLHPKSQIKLLNLLLKFAYENDNKILITTHSPLLAEMFNNYLILGQLNNDNQEIADRLGMENLKINPGNSGIYFFNGEKAVEVSASEYGAIFSSFKDAQERVHATNQYLSELMFKQENSTVNV